MADLKTVLTDPARRAEVIRDAERLLEDEVDRKSGLSGLAIKGAFKVVKGAKPGMVHDVIDGLLNDFAARLDPIYQAYLAQKGDIVGYFTGRKGDVADALLGITDDRARTTRHTALKKAYESLRPQGKKNVEEAVAGIARLIDKHGKAAG
ncbi:MAG: hypothetical protein JNK72_03765 [Myxococcales bacterium]|nr:hypothetical protein [Myxococcales bacterium]